MRESGAGYPWLVKGKGSVLGWIADWGWTVVAGVGAVLAVGGPFWGNFRTDETERWIAFIVGAIGALVALAIPLREKLQMRGRIAELEGEVKAAKVLGRAEFQYSLNYLLTPLLWKLGRLARTRPGTAERATAAGELKVKALDFLMRVTNPKETGLRATFFKCEGQGDELRLVADESTGEETRRVFDSTTIEGRRALGVVQAGAAGTTDFAENLDEESADRIDKNEPHSYATFASAAAYDGVEKIGLVTVDGQRPGDVTEVDQYVVRTVGTILAISEALRGNKR